MSVAACRYRPLVPTCEPQNTQIRCMLLSPAQALVPEHVACNHQALHLGGAFTNPPHARFAIPALQGYLLGDPITNVDLYGTVDHPPRHLARIELGNRRLVPVVFTAVDLPGAFPGQPAGGAN